MADNRSERAQTFDALYRAKGDPWNVQTSEYEQVKFAATLAALPPERRFRNVLDIGCSFGTLTAKLAKRGDFTTAMDVSSEAIAQARAEHGDAISFTRGELPDDWPAGCYDLIVMSEVLYFLSRSEVEQVATFAARDLSPNGLCLLINWTGDSDLSLQGEEAAKLFIRMFFRKRTSTVCSQTHPSFRIDLLESDAH